MRRQESASSNRPFSGALVPLSRYRRDRRVGALMVEVNRGLYLDEADGGMVRCWRGHQ